MIELFTDKELSDLRASIRLLQAWGVSPMANVLDLMGELKYVSGSGTNAGDAEVPSGKRWIVQAISASSDVAGNGYIQLVDPAGTGIVHTRVDSAWTELPGNTISQPIRLDAGWKLRATNTGASAVVTVKAVVIELSAK
jgi:hypothetical protein